MMQYKTFTTLFLAATALAAPAADSTPTESEATLADYDYYNYGDYLQDVPPSIIAVLVTAIPDSWYSEILDPASRDSVVSAAAAGTYPAWYNALPSSVKAWATADIAGGLVGASATAESSATQTENAGSSATETGFSGFVKASGSSGSQTAASRTSTSSSETPSAEASSSQVSSTAVETTSASSTTLASSSESPSPSSSESTGGAPAPTGAVAMSVAGAAGILALALAL
jgi:hypothetical protein